MNAGPDLFGDRRADLADRLAAWAATARADEAALSRSREGFLRRTAAEDATFVGVLLDLAERGGPVLVVGSGDRRHRGTVRAVGADFIALRTPDARDVLLSHRSIGSVRPEARSAAATGDRGVDVPMGLAEALAVLAEDRPRVLVVSSAGGEGLSGELNAVGRDVVTMRLDGSERRIAYVPISNIAEVSIA